ncbi:BCMO1 [Lepeophtheirus salmonis]|uniref:BCMO1 n=1 Tax=Lepeophtheirus salmonis TaxID=72036 RepID=A0A7R8CQ17_LEPSM|nr:BCMO1 [Lepeophtheirus salmonis]CAF2891146.1 BCMO1 [Lepeophtheirus salmonis]
MSRNQRLPNHSSCKEVKGYLTESRLPGWIKGILLYNSPSGTFDSSYKLINPHWMDGLALMSSFKIQNKGRDITFTKRHLKSEIFNACIEQGKKEKRGILLSELGTFSKALDFQEFKYRLKLNRAVFEQTENNLGLYRSMSLNNLASNSINDNCNNSFYQFGNIIMATSDTPYERVIDPESLETKDLIDMSHLFTFKTGRPLKDHNGDYYNLASSIVTGNKYHFIKYAKTSKCINEERCGFPNNIQFVSTIPSRFPNKIGYFHSFGMTDNHLIFCEQPLVFDVQKLKTCLSEGRSHINLLQNLPGERNQFYIVNKKNGTNP